MDRKIERVDFAIPQQPRLTRVAAYARVSSGKDAMLHSLSAQVSFYSSLIQSHSGWQYCGVYARELGRMIYDSGITTYYNREIMDYALMRVEGGTMLIEAALLEDEKSYR